MPATCSHTDNRPSFVTWKSIMLDASGASARYGKPLEKQQVKIGDWAEEILASCFVTRLNLVLVTVADLGFSKTTTYRAVCERARELDLVLCPAEAAIALRIEYRDQPVGELLRIAMEPKIGSEGQRGILTVERRRESEMIGWWRAHPEDLFQPTFRLIFTKGG